MIDVFTVENIQRFMFKAQKGWRVKSYFDGREERDDGVLMVGFNDYVHDCGTRKPENWHPSNLLERWGEPVEINIRCRTEVVNNYTMPTPHLDVTSYCYYVELNLTTTVTKSLNHVLGLGEYWYRRMWPSKAMAMLRLGEALMGMWRDKAFAEFEK